MPLFVCYLCVVSKHWPWVGGRYAWKELVCIMRCWSKRPRSWAEREEMLYHLNMEMMAYIFRQSLLDGIYSAAVEPESHHLCTAGHSQCEAGVNVSESYKNSQTQYPSATASCRGSFWSFSAVWQTVLLKHTSALILSDHGPWSYQWTFHISVYLLIFSPCVVRTGMGNVA